MVPRGIMLQKLNNQSNRALWVKVIITIKLSIIFYIEKHFFKTPERKIMIVVILQMAILQFQATHRSKACVLNFIFREFRLWRCHITLINNFTKKHWKTQKLPKICSMDKKIVSTIILSVVFYTKKCLEQKFSNNL